jgi:tetratricopeptide (TPR) repeat protein
MKSFLTRLAAPLLFAQAFLFLPFAWAIEINADGQALIQQASQSYSADLRNRPIVMDPDVIAYAEKIARRLVPKHKQPPAGVSICLTVIDSPKPELYSYVDGHMIMTTGVLYAMNNEAQLGGVMAHEIAQLVEGYYISMYQEIKAAERRQRTKAAAGAIFGAMLDVAVDYAVEVQTIRMTDRLFSGENTYKETMEKMAAVHSAQSVYYSISDVIDSIPSVDDSGQRVDPRQRFEPVADAQGMEYMALAGYDVTEAAVGWENIHRLNNALAREQALAMGAFAQQMQAMQGLMEINMQRLQQSLGASGLVQTLSDAPPSRAGFVRTLVDLKEVQAARKQQKQDKGKTSYMVFVLKTLLPKAEKALLDEDYDQAMALYLTLYDKGERTAPIAYGLAKGMLGDFAFGASNAEKTKAERRYQEAMGLDPKFALPYKGLGELYEDWERYEDAIEAYSAYLEKAPQANDHNKIERKIKMLKRKASR